MPTRTKYYHADEVAEILGKSLDEVRAMLVSGKLKGHKSRRRWLIDMEQPLLQNTDLNQISREQNVFELDAYGRKALELIDKGDSLFITGKAGTGKTTLLKEIERVQCLRGKKVAVVSPTGVAAKNAGGVTLHSFLRMPTVPYYPKLRIKGMYRLNPNEIEVVRQLDLIIVDEVSMVRCDVLDLFDDILRHYRKGHEDQPFGGIQMVFIGDLYQLMPVAIDEDEEILRQHYDSLYFFSSHAYLSSQCQMLELKNVYRQKNIDFINLLNKVREGRVSKEELKMLQSRVSKSCNIDNNGIRLTTHNRRAWGYNNRKLNSLPSEEYEFDATIEGYYPNDEFPTEYHLRLKEGARVMFVCNDTEGHQFVNGTMGTVVWINNGLITVNKDDGGYVFLLRRTWNKQQYFLNKETSQLDTKVCGSFTQYPVRLAWAVTIHKSQGLTFDKAVIDAGKAFACGQVYVALSRCRTFKGIKLVSPITEKSIKTDSVVIDFMTSSKSPQLELRKDDKTSECQKCTIDSTPSLTAEVNPEVVYSPLRRLIADGSLDVFKYLSVETYTEIASAIATLSGKITLQTLKAKCPQNIKYGEIIMFLFDIQNNKPKRMKNRIKFRTNIPENKIDEMISKANSININ